MPSRKTTATKREPTAKKAATKAVAARPETGKYVYCIIEARLSASFGKIGIGGRQDVVYTVAHKDLAAVVSDTPLTIYDPTRENVLWHEQVIERVMQDHSVLPMSFGTIFRTKDDVVEFLKDTHDSLRDVLGQVRDKLEFGVQVNWDRAAVTKDIESESEDVRRLTAQIERTGGGSTYFARVQLGRLIERLLSEKADVYVREIFDGLRGGAVASKLNKVIGETMILNAAFLVDRDKADRFDDRMHQVARKYEGRLSFRYTGPWPPYNFVNVRLTLEQPAAAPVAT